MSRISRNINDIPLFYDKVICIYIGDDDETNPIINSISRYNVFDNAIIVSNNIVIPEDYDGIFHETNSVLADDLIGFDCVVIICNLSDEEYFYEAIAACQKSSLINNTTYLSVIIKEDENIYNLSKIIDTLGTYAIINFVIVPKEINDKYRILKTLCNVFENTNNMGDEITVNDFIETMQNTFNNKYKDWRISIGEKP